MSSTVARPASIFKGSVVRFPEGQGEDSQIGWNQIEITQPDCPLYQDVEDGRRLLRAQFSSGAGG